MRKNTWYETLLLFCLLTLSLVYIFFFVLIPQDWSLIDHYASVLRWGLPGYNPIQAGTDYLKGLMSIGRFCALDSYLQTFWYWALPVTPRAFHLLQFVIAGLAFNALYALVRRMGLSFAQSLLALVVVAGSFPMKDWIFYTSTQEPVATLFLLLALIQYTAGRKWFAVPFYIAATLMMESFAVFLGSFFILEVWDWKQSGQRPGIQKLGAFIFCGVFGLAFAAFVYSLPHVYSQNAAVLHVGIFGILRGYLPSFILPPIKSLLPLILVVIYSRWRIRKQALPPGHIRVLLLGISIVFLYTGVLGAWAPFDSWFFLHETIPFGWAMILGALWIPESAENDRIHQGLLVASFIFLTLVVLNGSRNLTSMHSEFKTVAKIGCEESRRVPGIQIYSNCNEGSVQLRNYLIGSQECANPPTFHYLNRATSLPADIKPPYLFILTPKCDAFDASSVPADFVLPLSQWTVIKKL